MTTTTVGATESDRVLTAGARGRKKHVLLVGLLVLLLGSGYWLFLRPTGTSPEPQPGEVVTLEPIQVNLAGGRYLRIGIALQLTSDAVEVDGSKALDATISRFSGLPISRLDDAERREKLKKSLEKELVELYPQEVMGVYFVNFVTQ